MKIQLVVIGKTDNKQLLILTEDYMKRIKAFVKFELEIIPDLKNRKHLSKSQQKEKEGKLILSKLSPTNHVVLLDEKGKNFSSRSFATYIQKKMNSGTKNLVFIIGGPYGFSDAVHKQHIDQKIALSKMTFSHQMVRLIFLEQLYRAFSIINHHPYHHS